MGQQTERPADHSALLVRTPTSDDRIVASYTLAPDKVLSHYRTGELSSDKGNGGRSDLSFCSPYPSM